MFENPRRGRQARNFTTNVPKILVLKSSSEQIFSRKLPLGAPDYRPTTSSSIPTEGSTPIKVTEKLSKYKDLEIEIEIE